MRANVLGASIVLLLLVAGCGGSESAAPATIAATQPTASTVGPNAALPAPEASQASGSVPVEATDLAPSQIAASTVQPPDTPPPCDPGALTWVAAPGVDASELAVLTVTNLSSAWCEVDVSASPDVDPLMEPSVWLDPAASALLVVGSAASCSATASVTSIPLVVNGAQSDVSIPAINACPPLLTAFYPA